MKTLFNKTLALFGLLLVSSNLWAQETAAATNTHFINDNTMFYLLLGMALMQLIVIMVIGSTIKGMASNKNLWIEKFKNAGKAALVIGFIALATSAQAQNSTETPFVQMTPGMYNFMFILNGMLLFIIFILLGVLKNMVASLRSAEEIAAAAKAPSFVEKLSHSLTDAVPIEHEEEILTDHDYDGIRELDNNLPPWWVWGFYFTIINSFLYIGYYHFGSGNLQDAEYQAEVVAAQEMKAKMKDMMNENTVTLLTDAETIKKGAAIYKTNCVTCHRADLGGSVGPNLTDDYWIHGGDIKDLFKTVKYGVPQKGMISWESQLSPSEIQAVSSYIISMHGSNPVDPKEPQGELYTKSGRATESGNAVETDADPSATDSTAVVTTASTN